MLERGMAEGVRLFNAGKFFEAHEALEAAWLKAEGARKTLLHGLIQVAAAFHHHTRQNQTGFGRLLEKGCSKLEGFGPEIEGIDLAGLLRQLQRWREFAARPSGTAPPQPQITFTPDRASDGTR